MLFLVYSNFIQRCNNFSISHQGLEKSESCDLKGSVVDVMSSIGELRNAFSNLKTILIPVFDCNDTEKIELFLDDKKIREKFYDCLEET